MSPNVLRAQTPTPGPLSPEAARVDQLINESRQLMAKGVFEGIAEKGEQALVLSQKIGDKLRQSRSLMYIALGRFHTGRLDEAIDPFKQSAALAAEAGDLRQQALSLRSAGVLMVEAGQFDDALYFYNQALNLQRGQNNRAAEASLLGNIGRVYTDIHDYVKADKILLEALGMSRELHDELVEFSTLGKLVNLELNRSNYQQAVKYADDALSLKSAEIRDSLKNEVRLDLALAHFESDNKPKALELIEEVLAFERNTKIAFAEGETLAVLARVQLEMGKLNEALASAIEALALLRRAGADPSVQASVLYTQAQAQLQLHHNDEALANLRSAMGLIETARLLSVSTETSRAEFFAGKGDIYLTTIDLLAAQGKQDEALAVAESYHGRAFLDSLAESRADLRKALPPELLRNEDAILARISDAQRQLWQENVPPEREQQLKRNLAAAEESLEQFQLEVRRTNPLYANLKHPQPFATERIQRELLDPQTGLIEYVLGTKKSFAWLVLKDKIFFARLPPERELSDEVSAYHHTLAEKSDAITTARSIAKLNASGARLYKILLAPFQDHFASVRRLLIVPDKALAYVPFETLSAERRGAPNEYMVERFAIGYGPSASALAFEQLQQPVATSTFVAFGDPIYDAADLEPQRTAAANSKAAKFANERGLDLRRLPYTRTEVMNIGALFSDSQRKIFLGAEANEPNVKSAPLAKYRYVHFAAHGLVDEDVPSRSGVFLSMMGNEKEDGILQISEIMRLKLNSDLVTLSACRTGLGKVVGGEGVLGLTRAFLYAGSRSVVASLWNVNDTATAELMKAFYTNLKKGEAKDEALRQAKLTLLKGRPAHWRHPYYWAPFVLVGANN
jgi:CHAT domain-containing protein